MCKGRDFLCYQSFHKRWYFIIISPKLQKQKGHPGSKHEEQLIGKEIPTPIAVTVKDETVAGWPSFGQLVWDLAKLSVETLGGLFVQSVPSCFQANISKRGLTPLKDKLVMPEDEAEPATVLKQRTPTPLSETRQAHAPVPNDRFTEAKPPKLRSTSMKDPSKHRSSRRQEYAEFYGSNEIPPQFGQVKSKSQKERSKHRHREKSGDVNYGASSSVLETKPGEMKAPGYESTKYDPYNFRNKYGETYRYD